MKKMMPVSFALLFVSAFAFAQPIEQTHKTKVMPLGVFHFNYPNLDAVKVAKEDQISVLNEPYQSQILHIAKAIAEFKPTIIAVESNPGRQAKMDSLYSEYVLGRFSLGKNEIFQLGFRLAKMQGAIGVHCVDDMGKYYEHVGAVFGDSVRLSKLEAYNDSLMKAKGSQAAKKVNNVIDELVRTNQPEHIKERLGVYLSGLFCYEETEGDFWGVDFETSRWYSRNLRIFRNIQRIPRSADDRILLIIGGEHLNLLYPFFDASPEFELVSALPYLEKAKEASLQ
ncbi:MAG: DUF5694 domain-containing protein [Tenuifilaceae bacterium]|jgi:hypothetical protein|nr:DUF5694 domain-containing protein [Tenuifilaceae bacterium]